MTECSLVPTDPEDGDVFTCPKCGSAATFVLLDDTHPGEWVWQ